VARATEPALHLRALQPSFSLTEPGRCTRQPSRRACPGERVIGMPVPADWSTAWARSWSSRTGARSPAGGRRCWPATPKPGVRPRVPAARTDPGTAPDGTRGTAPTVSRHRRGWPLAGDDDDHLAQPAPMSRQAWSAAAAWICSSSGTTSGCAHPHSWAWSTRSLATCGRAVSRARGAARRGRRDRHPARRLRLRSCTRSRTASTVTGTGVLDPVHQSCHARAAGRAGPAARRADRFPCRPASCRAHQRCELIVAADPAFSRSPNGWPAGARGWRPTWTPGLAGRPDPARAARHLAGPRRCWPGCPRSGATATGTRPT